MERKKTKLPERKYEKPVSLYPLKPEEALSAFMQIDPKKLIVRERKANYKTEKK